MCDSYESEFDSDPSVCDSCNLNTIHLKKNKNTKNQNEIQWLHVCVCGVPSITNAILYL